MTNQNLRVYTVYQDDDKRFCGYSDIKVLGIKDIVEDGVLTIWRDSSTAAKFNWSRVRWYEYSPYASEEEMLSDDKEFEQQQEILASALTNTAEDN